MLLFGALTSNECKGGIQITVSQCKHLILLAFNLWSKAEGESMVACHVPILVC